VERYPEVIVVNETEEHILLTDISMNGCFWGSILAKGDGTAPGRCLPGTDHIHFKKFDSHSYCLEQAEDGTIDGICLSDPDAQPSEEMYEGLKNEEPHWFFYRTFVRKTIERGQFYRFEIRLKEIEQDFDVVGPYGH